MRGRDLDESHRTASQLELLFDLTFVVAASKLTGELAHGIADGHVGDTVVPFLQVFFAIWWAWMNFTWFASSYDTDDVGYRVLTLVQMAGVLVLASGVGPAMQDGEYMTVGLGYLVMRVGLVALWLRACVEDVPRWRTALRYAAGISVLLVLWLGRHAIAGDLPGWSLTPVFLLLAVGELVVPLWAERPRGTTWHPHHIAERYGLFAIILLGEGIFAASAGVDEVLDRRGITLTFGVLAVGGLVLVFSLWWLYFVPPTGAALAAHREASYRWGYGHYGVFAGLVALGAGLEVAIEQAGHPLAASDLVVASAVAVPVAVFLALLWLVHLPIVDEPTIGPTTILGSAGLCLVVPLAEPLIGVAGVVATLAAITSALVVISTTGERATPGRAALVGARDGR
jgi:low temperature requirement protein LtrA